MPFKDDDDEDKLFFPKENSSPSSISSVMVLAHEREISMHVPIW